MGADDDDDVRVVFIFDQFYFVQQVVAAEMSFRELNTAAVNQR